MILGTNILGNMLWYYSLIDVILLLHSQEMQSMKTIDDGEAFMLKHGENIVDTLGSEVDRIEKNLKVRFSATSVFIM